MKVTLKIDAKRFDEAVKRKFGILAENIVYGYFDQFVKATPMQTGRTVASWNLSFNAPVGIDAGEIVSPSPGTNSLPIGSEPGRGVATAMAEANKKKVQVRANPFGIFYITNAADLDSWYPEHSYLDQERSRAFLMDIGAIPGYNIYTGFRTLDPRGEGLSEVAKAVFQSNFSRGHYTKGVSP